MLPDLEPLADDDAEIISPAELERSRSSMNLTELKAKPIHELVKMPSRWGWRTWRARANRTSFLDTQGACAQR